MAGLGVSKSKEEKSHAKKTGGLMSARRRGAGGANTSYSRCASVRPPPYNVQSVQASVPPHEKKIKASKCLTS